MATSDYNYTNGFGTSAGKPAVPLKKMECLVCSHVVFPPVMQCKNWHLVCNNCRQQRDLCPDPDCKEDLGSATRSAVAEKFLDKYVLRCKYFYDGGKCMDCTLKSEMELMVAHEAICHFREVKCLVPGCYKQIQLMLLIKHFEKEHSIPPNASSKVHLNVSQLIMKKLMVAETIGDKSWKSFISYAIHSESIFLVIFRLTSLRSPLFEISTVVHGYYPVEPKSRTFMCRIRAHNESELKVHVNACYEWKGPIEQPYTLTPYLSWTDELGKLKWIVTIDILDTI